MRRRWHAQTSARAATLAALCGLAAAQDPGPGECKDVFDNPFNSHFHEITTCCVDGSKDKPMVWERGCADGAYVDTKCTSGCAAHSVFGHFEMCCTTECCAAPTPRGHGVCPEFSPGQFPQVGGIRNCTDVVQFHFVWQASADMEDETQRWMEGLSMTAGYINGQGGLRMGEGQVGYVNMTFTEYHANHAAERSDDAKLENYYVSLCGQSDVDVLILPLVPSAAITVARALRAAGKCKKPVLTGSDADEIFEAGYSSMWSPSKKSTVWTAEQADFLYSLGAKKFVVVGDRTSETALGSVRDAIERHADADVAMEPCLEDTKDGWERCFNAVRENAPGMSGGGVAFIGLGEGQTTFETLVKFFQANEYAPQAAMYMDLTDRIFDDSNQKQLSWLYDMWMAKMSWNLTMPHQGPTEKVDPYAANRTDGDGTDLIRYMGGASDFAANAQYRLDASLKPKLLHPYHAKAAATIVMLQIAVEHAPDTDGYGLEFDHTDEDGEHHAGWDPDKFNEAMLALDVQTFWGPIKLDPTGWNTKFTMGVAQFKDGWKDNLIGPSQLLADQKSSVVFPAEWNCQLTNSCWEWWETVLVVVAAVAVAALIILIYVKRKRKREMKHHVVRESLVGGAAFMPDAQLANKDVSSRWHDAARLQSEGASETSSIDSTNSRSFSASTRRLRGDASQRSRTVMFTDAHLHELRPADWNAEENVVGKGSFGMVFKATWRGQEVAVKHILLPEEPASERDEAREDRKKRVREITKEFVSEVEVCCDLAHPNLVRLMGFSTKEGLLMVQELMLGQALDKQLYVERWRPSKHQIKRVAEDVAQGMRYLHTAFNDAAGLDKPIIHRDLKSPNLLLARTPGPGPQGEVTVKISDFGLSREKETTQEVGTVMMTGCGSVLWMAPEILLGRRYNEKVDVFSYAMCLVELVDCNLPWAGTATSMEVPNVVTKGRRPDKQLARATDQMRSLIRRCWHEDPSKRPSFTEIVGELTGASVAPVAARSAPVGMSRWYQQQPASLGSVPEDIEHGQSLEWHEARLREVEEELEQEKQKVEGELTIDPEVLSKSGESGANGTECTKCEHLQKQASGLQLQLADAKHEIQELQHKLAAGASNARMQEDYALEAPSSILVRRVVHLPEAGPEPWWNILLRPKANVVIASVYWLVVLLCTHRTIAVDNLSTLSGVFCCIVASMLPASVIEFVFKLLHETVRGRHDSHVLHSITDAGERDRMSHTGWLGTLMFAFGIWDTVRQVQFAVHVSEVGGTLLFYCVVSSVVCTLATTWILAFGILDEIILAENSSGQNVQRALTKGYVLFIFLGSGSRIESLAMVRLRLCGCSLASFPMKPKHFFFIGAIGWYHLAIKDVPQLVIALLIGPDPEDSDGVYDTCGGWVCRQHLDPSTWTGVSLRAWTVISFVLRCCITLIDASLKARVWHAPAGSGEAPYSLVTATLNHRMANWMGGASSVAASPRVLPTVSEDPGLLGQELEPEPEPEPEPDLEPQSQQPRRLDKLQSEQRALSKKIASMHETRSTLRSRQILLPPSEALERERLEREKAATNLKPSEHDVSQLQRQLSELREEHRLATNRRLLVGVSRPASPGGLSDRLLGGAE